MIYEINAGKNNDTKFRIPDIFTGKFKKTWKVSLSPECWYPQELGYNQINKLVGVTEFWSANNKNSVMVGWEPCYLPETEILEKYPHCKNLINPIEDLKYFNIYWYTNDKDGGHEAILWTVIPDWRIADMEIEMKRDDKMIFSYLRTIQFDPAEKEFHGRYKTIENPTTYVITLKSFLREIFIWFGGTRKAPHKMRFKVD